MPRRKVSALQISEPSSPSPFSQRCDSIGSTQGSISLPLSPDSLSLPKRQRKSRLDFFQSGFQASSSVPSASDQSLLPNSVDFVSPYSASSSAKRKCILQYLPPKERVLQNTDLETSRCRSNGQFVYQSRRGG